MSDCPSLMPRKRFLMTIVDDQYRVCVCSVCVTLAEAEASYAPGCRCRACRGSVALLDAQLDVHGEAQYLKVYCAPAGHWPMGPTTQYLRGGVQ